MENVMGSEPIIVGITGASGVIFGVRLLEILRSAKINSHLVISKAGAQTILEETDRTLEQVKSLATVTYSNTDIGAPVSSGSFPTRGMIVVPCSMRTMSEIATGATSTLIGRAADVILKERRRLVLVARETPLHIGHLRSMLAVTEIGAIVAPPVPAFYNRPSNLDDIINHTVGRCLDLFGLDTKIVKRWGMDRL